MSLPLHRTQCLNSPAFLVLEVLVDKTMFYFHECHSSLTCTPKPNEFSGLSPVPAEQQSALQNHHQAQSWWFLLGDAQTRPAWRRNYLTPQGVLFLGED